MIPAVNLITTVERAVLASPVVRVSSTGERTGYGSASANAAAVGVAMVAAQAAAASGDTIHVYQSATPATALGKSGVNWWFAPGVTVSRADAVLWSIGAATFSIFGGNHYNAGPFAVFASTDPAANLTIFAESVGGSANYGAFSFDSGGTLKAKIVGNINGGVSSAIYLVGATADIECANVVGGSSSDFPIQLSGTSTLRLRTGIIQSATGGYEALALGGSGSGDTVVADIECMKITKPSNYANAITLGASGDSVTATIRCPLIEGNIMTAAGVTTNVRIIDALIQPNKANEVAVTVNEDGLILQNCVIVNNGSGKALKQPNSGSKTLTYYGTLSYTGVKDGNVTLVRGPATATNVP
jgi:hypothetical protein